MKINSFENNSQNINYQFLPEKLIKIDLAPFGVDNSDFYIYLDFYSSKISGNKARKLKGSMDYALNLNYQSILTIGGNRSNHIFAAAQIPAIYGLQTVVIIKGHPPKYKGYTIRELEKNNIPYYFFPSQMLKNNFEESIEFVLKKHPKCFFIPEGGSNEWAKAGFEPLIPNFPAEIIAIAAGTGGTARAIQHFFNHQTLAYAVVKDGQMIESLKEKSIEVRDASYGGYGKVEMQLVEFLMNFYQITDILMDPIYNGKALFRIVEDYKSNNLDSTRKTVLLHTGGLQGWYGVEEQLKIDLGIAQKIEATFEKYKDKY